MFRVARRLSSSPRLRRASIGGGLGLSAILVLLIAIFNGPVIFADDDVSDVRLMVGRSTVLDIGKPIARVSLTSSDVADALVTSTNQLLINGKTPGTISMFVWDRSGGIRRFEVVVQRDLAQLNDQVKSLFPGETIAAASNGRSIVLSGNVSNKDVAEKAVNVAAGYVEKKEEVVNLLQIREGEASNQVLLRVRFAEVNRSALTELGAQLFTGANGYKNFVGRSTTEQFPAPVFDSNKGGLVFSDYLNLFLFDMKRNLGIDIKALQSRGLLQTLAEPNLVAESGKEASFLAGGEFPVPIAQPSGGAVAVTILFKEFGIRLNFTPVVNGDRIHLKVRPEVSTLDFANAVTLQGFRIPALSTRRAETELELMNGQTFAIAGLLDNSITNTMQKIPGIGDIPILGELFKTRSAQKDRTELVVMITPEILPKNSPGVTTELPRGSEKFLAPIPEKQQKPLPPPAFTSEPKPSDEDLAAARQVHAPKPVPAPAKAAPADAAAAVSALTPAARPVTHAEPAPSAPSSPAATPASEPKPMSAQDQDTLSRSHKQEVEQQQEQKKIQERLEKRAAKEREEQAKKDKEEQQKQAKAAKIQAEKDAKAAKIQAEKDAKAAKEQAERDREDAKKKAEVEQKQQKAITEAAAKLKAAQDAYQAELSKKRNQQL
jgi:pilus assembly protein CpaC